MRIVNFEEPNPHHVLGPHKFQLNNLEIVSVRAYLPRAVKAWVNAQHNAYEKSKAEMTRLHPS